MNFNLHFLYGHIHRRGVWVRFAGKALKEELGMFGELPYYAGFGFVITKGSLLFSERLGKTKYYPLIFGYRLRILKRGGI